MNNEKIKKTNLFYLLIFILAPIVIGGAVMTIVFFVLPENIGPMVSILVFAAAVAWWSYGAKAIHKRQQKKLEQQLDGQGFRLFLCNRKLFLPAFLEKPGKGTRGPCRRKLHIPRPAAGGRSRSFRCSSSPHKSLAAFAGSPYFLDSRGFYGGQAPTPQT